ncbi:MAG: LTA synthase family protein [gamma proteobacterium symbiont of Bathyaustriella thionipta]|nr:LTA synthase family protein [gamma proteobacterium symbiont of Bathyaustriella thionipta]MCU7949404.1 LTA synthase family protein [gamma proteobacterium symbiont of Bathyaustriella thionipta]MCU7953609.1 LTA synthase family protein [gamma proteobacterium symbiont of Bathyaustriella thionipta]MCU7956258.1 LTA synthase family protein [gamma proteobacterium symbiont of Bathyaustriella thionipta]MCU7965986.1 LTA synthase family protein [gamma proteobacterium symbiont of Bathyaustriella thionipta
MRLIKILAYYFMVILSVFFVGRVVLFNLYFERFAQSDVNYWLAFLYGLKMDVIVVCASLLIPVILLTLAPKRMKNIVNQFLTAYFFIAFLFFIYIENATLPFFAEYDVRPNFLFVEYLEYPQEVFNMIFSAYKLELFIALMMLFTAGYVFLKTKKFHDFSAVFEIHYFKRFMLFFPLIFILAIGIRSSFGHRPANISDAMYSSNRIVNEVTKNSVYSIAYAIYRDKKYGNSKLDAYGEMDINEAMERVSNELNIGLSAQGESPFSREEKTHFTVQKPKNLVIFLQESLGSQFVEVTGGEPGITPHFNRLSQEGILFTNLFSNGTRSIRGIAGSVAGNFSVPGKGVIKRNKSQNGFFTIASLLKPLGYRSLFIYGGESRFDNMRGWFVGNGFDEIIDQSKFIAPEFTGTWGVSDEDMVLRSHQEFKKMHEQNQPFAAVMFSTSNHSPFDFPQGKIELIEGIPEKSELNAIKYADHAIGRFIEEAKKEAYYNDTVFVIVADHNIRVRGSDMLPVKLYHIPGMILGGGIDAKTIDRLTTQPDVLATALDLTGQNLTYPILGRSVFSDKKRDLSLMQFNDTYALRMGDKVAVLRPEKEALTFLYQNQEMLLVEHDKELEKKALAFILTMNHLYQKRLYK